MKRPKFQNILVPVDFSAMSIVAIETAKRLTRRFSSRIHLVHVQDSMYPAVFMDTTPLMTGDLIAVHEENTNKLREDLRDLAARLDLSPDDCHVSTVPLAFDAICAFAQHLSIDLIVMPTHGRTGLKHVFLGSTAERVVQHSPCPVFVVRERTGPVNTILVPVDFSGCSLDALNYAIKFAQNVAAKIIVIHAVNPSYACPSDGYAMYDLSETTKALRKDAERQMRAFVRGTKFGTVKFQTTIQVGLAVDEICAFAKNKDVDLIITGTHGRTGFKHVLIGSTAENLVRHADRPVLVVPSNVKMRLANLTQGPSRREVTSRGRREEAKNRKAKSAITNKRGSNNGSAFPERRKTNKFRESHLKK